MHSFFFDLVPTEAEECQRTRGGSTNLFTLCKVYLVLVPHSVGSQATDRFNSVSAAQLHINIPISGLISLLGMPGFRSVDHFNKYHKNFTVQLTSVRLTHAHPN